MLEPHPITAAGNWQQVWKSKSTQICHPPGHQSKRTNAYVADRTSGRGGGSTPCDICRASLKLAPKRRPKFPVPLYIPYFFMVCQVPRNSRKFSKVILIPRKTNFVSFWGGRITSMFRLTVSPPRRRPYIDLDLNKNIDMIFMFLIRHAVWHVYGLKKAFHTKAGCFAWNIYMKWLFLTKAGCFACV